MSAAITLPEADLPKCYRALEFLPLSSTKGFKPTATGINIYTDSIIKEYIAAPETPSTKYKETKIIGR